jgi:hypothetical protein
MGDPVKIEGGTAVKCNVPVAEAAPDEAVLPERVREALGRLVGAAKEGLLALSVEDRDRTAVRHGHENGEVTLGGRRVWGETAADQDRGRRVRGAALDL